MSTGWYEFVTPGEKATTHIAYVYGDGSVYLPEGFDVVTYTDFRMAAATDRFWRLVREQHDDTGPELARRIAIGDAVLAWDFTQRLPGPDLGTADNLIAHLRAIGDAAAQEHQ